MIEKFRTEMTATGEWGARRLHQVREGLMEFAREQVVAGMMSSRVVKEDLDRLGEAVSGGDMTLRAAASQVATDYLKASRE